MGLRVVRSGFLTGFFVITDIGFLVAAVMIGGRRVVEVVVVVFVAGVVVFSLLTDWNVVNSSKSTDVVVLSKSFLSICTGAEDVGNGNLLDVGLLKDGRLEVVDEAEPVDEDILSLWEATTVVGNLVESVAKTVVDGLDVGFLFRRTPEETLIISKLVLLEGAGVVDLWLVVEDEEVGF